MYEEISKSCKALKRKTCALTRAEGFSILEWSKYEISWDSKEYFLGVLSNIDPSLHGLSNKKIVEIAFDLGIDQDKTYGKDPIGFLKACYNLMKTSDQLYNGPKNYCNALLDDERGISCYNSYCKQKHK